MLKIIGTAEGRQASVEFDPQVPFSLKLGVPPAGVSFVLHCREESQDEVPSMLEVWIHPRTGAIHDVTLVSINPQRVRKVPQSDDCPKIPTSGRTPICDTAEWMKERKPNNPEEPARNDIFKARRLDLLLGRDFASLRIDGQGEPFSWIVNQRARFGLDAKGMLCRIDLIGLTPQDMAGIKEAVAPCEPRQE